MFVEGVLHAAYNVFSFTFSQFNRFITGLEEWSQVSKFRDGR